MGALTDIASSDSVSVLMKLLEDPATRLGAIRALGEIADSATLPVLRAVLASPGSESERWVAARAVRQGEIASRADPVPALLAMMESAERVDMWAVRHLARLSDPRAVEPIAQALASRRLATEYRVALAAALLSHGDAGRAALRRAAGRASAGAGEAAAALSLVAQ